MAWAGQAHRAQPALRWLSLVEAVVVVVLVVPAGNGRVSVSALTLAAAAAATAALAAVADTPHVPGVERGVVAGGAMQGCGYWSVLRDSTIAAKTMMM